MKRTEFACYALLASALVLAGLLVTTLQDRSMANQAHAHMAVTRDNFTAMTAKTRENEQALFVLENTSQRLLVYTVNLTHNRIDLAYEPIPLAQLFEVQQPGSAPRTRRPR